MEEHNDTTDRNEQQPDEQTQKVKVQRVGNHQDSTGRPKNVFNFSTSSFVSRTGCLWMIPAAIIGLLTMGCAGLVGLCMVTAAGAARAVHILLGKNSREN